MDKPLRRVLVVDDETYSRSATAQLLRQNKFDVAEASNAIKAKKSIETFDPDAVVVDIELGDGPNGLELIDALQKTHSHIAFVLLSNFAPTKADLFNLNNVAFLSKRETSNINRVVMALEEVLEDRDPADLYPITNSNALENLTTNQLEILKLLASGATNWEIAQQRDASLRAIEKSIERIYAALNLKRDGISSPRISATRIYLDAAGKP